MSEDSEKKKYWWAAHIITYTRFLDGNQDFYPVEESVFLIEATPNEAYNKAVKLGESIGWGDKYETLFYGGRRAVITYGGVRKLVLCEDDGLNQPTDESEITYQRMLVADEESFHMLLNDEDIIVELESESLWPF